MNASALRRTMLACPAAALFAAGAAIACPPESEKSGAAPTTEIQLREAPGGLIEIEALLDGEMLSLEPAMAVFADEPVQREGTFFGPGEAAKRYRIARPSGGRAEAQTFTATRGNGQASARARAEIGELMRRVQALQEDAMSLQELASKQAVEKQATEKKALRRKGVRLGAVPPPPPSPPVAPIPPAAPHPGADVQVEGRAIVIGPDGQAHEYALGGAPAAPSVAPRRLLREHAVQGQPLPQHEVQALEEAAIERSQAPKVWIGVELAEPDAGLVRYFELEPGQSTEIARVYEGSPAAKAGLKDRDIVIRLNGAEMAGPDVLREVIGSANPGDAIRVTVLRKGRTHEIDLRPALREQPAPRTVQGFPLEAARGTESGADLERRMARIERMLEKLLEEESRD